MTNSRAKGKRAELEIANYLKNMGYNARRGVQYQGGPGSPDVVGLRGIHIEVKHVEQLNIHKAMEQSCKDAAIDELPVVIHRKNRTPWLVTMGINEFMEMYDAYLQRRYGEETE